ncbi:DJ-1/PfpI family protein [Paenibacillus sp. P13VS]|uniref:DJ-1/PfpI family protein n=1 Tax=Paenibacillus sp. P13VS TaxID=2697367 RepID=UPI00187B1CA4|nr:DJ-1/PfpI family protein [Paenibacillus sp. P13VS]MBE7680227.1 DJ-1/PfpI family protein [Paenibacillus sp. P13VS]
MLNVQIVLFDGFDLLDAIAPYEVFIAASMYAEEALRVELVTAEGPRHVTSGIQGLEIEATGKLDPECGGMILVPGASGKVSGEEADSIPIILNRAAGTEISVQIRQALEREDVLVATVCGGSLLLAMAGLLEGRHAVTHHMGIGVLGATGAIPIQARIVDDGNLVSAGGVTSGLDVALYLVERALGPRIAHAVEQLFEFERRGTVWKAEGVVRADDMDAPGKEEGTEFAPITIEQMHSSAPDYEGKWEVIISTPIGKLETRLVIHTDNGSIRGTATQDGETVELIHPRDQGDKLVWDLRVSKPMKLQLHFEVIVQGDVMTGTAKAAFLPASKLNGHRLV